MHFIIDSINNNYFFLKVFQFIKIKTYYLKLTSSNNNYLANKLKQINILPLQLEHEEKLSSDIFSDSDSDPKKKNIRIINSFINNKISNLFLKEIGFKSKNVTKILINDYIVKYRIKENASIKYWHQANHLKKIIYIIFDLEKFFFVDKNKNLFKIYIPLDFLVFVKKILSKIFYFFFYKVYYSFKINNYSNKINKKKLFKIAYILHGNNFYGEKNRILYNKDLYYSKNIEVLKKKNIIHFGYLNKDITNIENYININKFKDYYNFKPYIFLYRSFFLIKKFSDLILIKILFIELCNFIYFRKFIKNYSSLKLAIIDYDILCPKILILAFQSLKIKTLSTQERFIASFYNTFSVISDYYFTSSNYINKVFRNNKFILVKNFISVGQYRVDKFKKYKNSRIYEVNNLNNIKNKKIIIALGYQSISDWFLSDSNPLLNISSQKLFLNDMIKLSENLKDCFIIIRLKSLDGPSLSFFDNELKIIKNSKKITLSFSNTAEYQYSLCSKADLVIAKHTSLLDECISFGIPCLIYDYTHNLGSIIKKTFDYNKSRIICGNYSELFKRSYEILNNKDYTILKELRDIRKKYYYYDKKEEVKTKIHKYINNIILK